MKNSVRVTGEFLNLKLDREIEVYLDGEYFNTNEVYTVFTDGSIQNSKGHEVAYDFVCDDILEELELK